MGSRSDHGEHRHLVTEDGVVVVGTVCVNEVVLFRVAVTKILPISPWRTPFHNLPEHTRLDQAASYSSGTELSVLGLGEILQTRWTILRRLSELLQNQGAQGVLPLKTHFGSRIRSEYHTGEQRRQAAKMAVVYEVGERSTPFEW